MNANHLFLFASFLAFLSCNSNDVHKQVAQDRNISKGKAFFKFDGVDYYYFPLSGSDIPSIVQKKAKSITDSMKAGLLIYDTPKSLSDTTFVSSLLSLGYRHREIQTDQFSLLDSIFTEKPKTEYSACPSEVAFTDVLIFRNDGEIIGTVKFSYDCNLHFSILGANANTATFGQDGEFRKLITLRP